MARARPQGRLRDRAQGAAREAGQRAASGRDQAGGKITLDDLPRLHAEGVTPAEIVQRIRAADASFEVTVDQLIQLSRQGVSKDVLKEVWARRASPPDDGFGAGSDAATPVAATSRPSEPAPAALTLQVESGGNFSLLVPAAFRTHRESRGANALVSFLLGDNDKTTGLAEAELSVFRYRSSTPDRLTESNLDGDREQLPREPPGFVRQAPAHRVVRRAAAA